MLVSVRSALAAFALAALPAGVAADSLAERTSDPAPVGERFDHLACYKVGDSRHFAARVELDSLFDELGIPSECRVVGRSRALCTPVRKRVLGLRYRPDTDMAPLDMPGDHLRDLRLCYRIECPVGPFVGALSVEDQFGRHRLRGIELKRLCTNARLVPDVTTTTTTLPPDPCALVDCVEGHFCRPSCEDPRAAECVPFAAQGDACGGFVPRCMVEICAPGLECAVPPMLPDAPGICVRERDECADDDDCEDGTVCEPGGPIHGSGNVCVPGCREDADCPPEHACVEVQCVATPCPPMCVPAVPPECGPCVSDVDCAPGTRCNAAEVCLQSCECPECDVCAGNCVPSGCGDCYSDADCPTGSRCNATDVCLPPCDCPLCAVCSGKCSE